MIVSPPSLLLPAYYKIMHMVTLLLFFAMETIAGTRTHLSTVLEDISWRFRTYALFLST